MDRPYDDNEVLGLTDVDDGTPIPPGTGANPNGPRRKAKAGDMPPRRGDTFASGDQAAAWAQPSNWVDKLRIQAQREPMVTLALAAGAGLLAGLVLRR